MPYAHGADALDTPDIMASASDLGQSDGGPYGPYAACVLDMSHTSFASMVESPDS